jgi:hypothetical protein
MLEHSGEISAENLEIIGKIQVTKSALFEDLIEAYELEKSQPDGSRTYPVGTLIWNAVAELGFEEDFVMRVSTAACRIVQGELDG